MKTTTPTKLSDLAKLAIASLWKGKACEKVFTSSVFKAIDFFGESLEISTAQMDEYKKFLSATQKPATVNQKLTNINTVLKFGHARGWVKQVPMVQFNKINNGRDRVLSEGEQERILKYLRSRDQRQVAAFIELLLITGCRRSELLNAQPHQIEAKMLRIDSSKNGKPRSVPINARAKELLTEFLPFNLPLHTLHRTFVKAKKECGIDDEVVLHSMRHTAATRMLRKTKDIHMVGQILGHSSTQMTNRYTHLVDDDKFDALYGD